MFIGPRITKVFASRWHTAFWAVGILLAAYGIATHGGPSASDVAQVASMAGAATTAASTAANPWAPGPGAPAPDPQPAAAAAAPVAAPAVAAESDPPLPGPRSQTSTNGLAMTN